MSNKLGMKYIRILKNKIVVNFTRDGNKNKKEFPFDAGNKELIKTIAIDYRNKTYLESNKSNTGIRHTSLHVVNDKLYLKTNIGNFSKKHIINTIDDINNVIDKVVYSLVNELGFCNRNGINTIRECDFKSTTLKVNLRFIIINDYSKYLESYIYRVTLTNGKQSIVKVISEHAIKNLFICDVKWYEKIGIVTNHSFENNTILL